MSGEPKVLSIVGQRNDDIANADAIECLKTWLARVESEEITSVAIAGVGPGIAEYGHSIWVDERLVGALAICQQDIVAKLLGDDE